MANGQPSKGPNILLIHADQHRYDCVGVNGHRLLKTPHLDRLAGAGVNFSHAFTPNPVCSPARACLQTGTWATTHKCITIYGTEAFQTADRSLPVLTQLLADTGYRVGHVGKFHAEVAGGPTDHGAEEYVPSGRYKQWREAQGLPPQPRSEGWFGEVDPHVTPGQSPLAWQADQTIGMIERYSSDGRPFFIRWDPTEPHLPNIVPEPYASMYPPESIEPWPSFPDPLTGKPYAQRRTRQRWGVDEWDWSQWSQVVGRYLGEITLLDAQVGRLLDTLDRLGLGDDTLVVYTTDHGDMCGGHGMMDKHYVMYDDVVRVPLMMRWPSRLPRGATCDVFVTHEIDLARTFLEVAGIAPPENFVGRNLVNEATGKGGDLRQDVFTQYQGTHQGLFSQRMLRDRRWKYVYNAVAEDELYDLEHDRGEITNRAADPACAEVLRRMRERMGQWMVSVKDPLSPPLFSWKH